MKILYKVILIFSLFIINSYFPEGLYAQNRFENWILTSKGWNLISDFSMEADVQNNSAATFSDTLILQIPDVWEAILYVIDINKDGYNEIIVSVVHSNGIGKIYAFNREWISLPDFPFQLPRNSLAQLSFYDEIIIASYVAPDKKAYFLGINSEGYQVIPEVLVGEVMHFTKDPVVADITGDGKEEIIFLYANGETLQSKLIFYNPRDLNIIVDYSLPYSQVTPAIGDIDGDGVNDVVHETGIFFDEHIILWAFKGDGTFISGFPKTVTKTTDFAGVQLADYLGDSRPEIILQLLDYPNDVIKLLSSEGEKLIVHSFTPVTWAGPYYSAFGKYTYNSLLNNPPILIIIRGAGLYYFDMLNNLHESVNLTLNPGGLITYRTLPNDTTDCELFTVAVQTSTNFFSRVYVIDKNKQIVKQINLNHAENIRIFDIENNGTLDVIYHNNGSFYVITDFYQYDPEKIEWPYEKHDLGRTSNYNFSNSITPVELTSFTSSFSGSSVELNWTTASEINNFGFEIEKSKNSNVYNEMWYTIGFISGNGTTTEPKSYSFIDDNVTSGVYKYRLKQIDYDGSNKYSDEIKIVVFPGEFVLEQNYPNPFNPNTVISYRLPVNSNVTLKVYDILGNEVVILVNEEKQPGVYEVEFDASNLSSGIYFYQLKADGFVQTRKMILLR